MKESDITSTLKEDIPKKTVLVLLVMAIVIVALGIWTILDRIGYSQIPPQSSSGGEVKLKIVPGNAVDNIETLSNVDEAQQTLSTNP